MIPYIWILKLVALGSLVLGVGYGIHKFLKYEQQIGYDKAKAEYTEKLVEAQNVALANKARMEHQIQEAQNASIVREQTLQKTSAAAASSSASLRIALDSIRSSVPQSSPATLRDTATSLGAILGDCTEKYRELAEKAQRHTSDIKTITESWPK